MKIYRIFVTADFAYNGAEAWAESVSSNYRRLMPLNAWKVSNWHNGWENSQGKLLARAYARGNFYWGYTVYGNEIVMNDVYEDLRVTCNMEGKIFRN